MNNPPTDAGHSAPAGFVESPHRPRIVVGLDGSDSSIEALRRAVRLAQALNASLEGVIAWSYPLAMSAYAVTALPGLEDSARTIAAEVADQVFGSDWPEWFTLEVRQGNAALALMKESDGAEMLVVGSRGHGGFAGLLLGSVSAECARHALCPVLVVRGIGAKAAAVKGGRSPRETV
jgi:nucleotide-binding universal stress UspA family protein